MSNSNTSRPSLLRSLSSTSSVPQTNKPRLYIALYPRGGSCSSFTPYHSCDSYHWSLIVGPQTASRKDPGTRYHLAHTTSPITSNTRRTSSSSSTFLLYEENDLPTHLPASAPLIRIAIAKVTDLTLLTTLLRSLPVPSSTDPTTTTPHDPSYTCYTFIRDAYHLLLTSNCLKSYLSASDWPDIERCARKYCKKKRDQRRFSPDATGDGRWDPGQISTFNFWENRETTR